MPNPLFQRFGGVQPNASPQQNNLSNLFTQFNNFRQTFRGNPKQQVEQLLATGQMSKQQYEQLSQMAQQFQQMFGKR